MGVNHSIFEGRFCSDVEIRNVGNSQVASFRFAVNNGYKKDGAWVDKTAFLQYEAWGKTAETMQERFAKGDPLVIHADVSGEEWESDGQKRSAIKFRVKSFDFVQGWDYDNHCRRDAKNGTEGAREGTEPTKKVTNAKKQEARATANVEVDLPF